MKRKNLQGYVRLDSNQRPIGASLIARKKKPYGRFKEMLNPSQDICCPPGGISRCFLTSSFTDVAFTPSGGGVFTGVDSSCNTYLAYWQGIDATETSEEFAVLKRDGDGNLIWNKRIVITKQAGFSFNNAWAAGLEVDSINNRVFLADSNAGITCLNAADGTVLYCKRFNNSEFILEGYQLDWSANKFTISPDGAYVYLTVNGQKQYPDIGYKPVSSLLKIDASNGNILKQVDLNLYLESPGGGTGLGWYGISSDSTGLYGFPYWLTPSFTPRSFAHKLDWDLNELSRSLVFPNFADAPQAANGYVYTSYNSNPASIIKVNGNTGSPEWAGQLGSLIGNAVYFNDIRIDAKDNIYFIGTVNLPPDSKRSIIVNKITPDGATKEFSYRIDDVTGRENMYWGFSGVQGPNVIASKLLIPSYDSRGATQMSLELKLGLENLTGVSNTSFSIVDAPYMTWANVPPVIVGASVATITVETYLASHFYAVPCTTVDSAATFTLETI